MSSRRKELERKLATYVGKEIGAAWVGRDPVNEPMINQWCDAMGDENPVYTNPEAAKASIHEGIVAPPAMLHAWTMYGLRMRSPATMPKTKQVELHALLGEYGYSSVVATNCEQGYTRYLRPGDRLSVSTVIESISEQKATALGIGYFIDTRDAFSDQNGEVVGWQTFRVLRFKPHDRPQVKASTEAAASKPTRLRPPKGHDNAWWWEGIERGELLIQKCSGCGVLRHPPRPMCGRCQSTRWATVAAKGSGRVYSYTVLHHPKFPGFEYPLVCAIVELDEGVRMVSNVVGCAPEDVHIEMPVVASIENVDDAMKLPLFMPAEK